MTVAQTTQSTESPLLTDEVRSLLTRRLALAKDRSDVEVLAVTGVRYGNYSDWAGQTHGGITFEVEFTYTTGRRQRRTAEVGWPIGIYTSPGEHGTARDQNMPAALWGLLTTAITVANRHGGTR